MVSACAGDTARFATTCSPSSTIPKWPPTTTQANESCVPPRHIARSPAASALTGAPTSLPQSAPSSEPPPDEASTPIRPSARPYAGNPFSNRVEQIPSLGIDEIEGRPILVVEGAPNCIVVIDRDRIIDPHVLGG